jgi:predicted P-loop ATPase
MGNLITAIQDCFPDARFNIASQELEYGPIDNPSTIEHPSYAYLAVGLTTGHIPNKKSALKVLHNLAWENRYDPVRSYLNRCRQSSQPCTYFRSLASDLLGCRKSAAWEILTEGPESGRFIPDVVLERSLIGAVARAFQPGCRHDTVLILNNSRDQGQCQVVEILAQPNDLSSHKQPWVVFDETPFRDLQQEPMVIHKGWFTVFDAAEQRFRKARPERVRAFFSQTVDRPSRMYATKGDVARHGVIAGACYGRVPRNPEYGRPCFLPINVAGHSDIDLARLESDRDAIWAAAVQAYDQRSPHNFSEREFNGMKPYLAQFPTI